MICRGPEAQASAREADFHPMSIRQAVYRGACAVGAGEAVSWAYQRRTATARRDARDNRHLGMLLAFLLRSDSNCVDIGAHRGDVLSQIVRLAPGGRHVAFEPLPDFHGELVRRFPMVEVRRAAVAAQAGESSFVHVRSAPGYSGLREREYPGAQQLERITVQLECLDEVLDPEIRRDLIKIDVEGAELGVLTGAIQTLRRDRPAVWFEHGQGAAEAYDTRPEDIFDLLTAEAGMRIFDADGRGPYDRDRFRAAFEGRMWTWLAR